MSHERMASLWRFEPAGSIWFKADGVVWKLFDHKFRYFGGMTPSISKRIGH